jgi:hypothetical protein
MVERMFLALERDLNKLATCVGREKLLAKTGDER